MGLRTLDRGCLPGATRRLSLPHQPLASDNQAGASRQGMPAVPILGRAVVRLLWLTAALVVLAISVHGSGLTSSSQGGNTEGDSGIALHSHRHRGKTHTRIHHLAHYFNGGDASTAEEDSSKAGSGTSEHRAEAAEARETRETSKAEEKGADLSFREDSTDHKTDSKDGDNDGSDGSDSKVSATRKTAEKDEEAASEGSKESKDSEKSSETSKAAGDRLKHLEYSDADPDRLSKEVTQIAEKAASQLMQASGNTTKHTGSEAKAVASGAAQLEEYSSDLRAEPVRKSLLRVSWGNKLVLEPSLWQHRQQLVVHATQVAWDVYEAHAFGYDELAPISLKGVNAHGGLAATLLASLDTLHMMDLHGEFNRAAAWVAENLTFSHQTTVVTKDAISNCVGGLLGAYELSRNATFLEKAAGLTSALMKAFERGVLPARQVALNHKEQPGSQEAILRDFGGVQMELWALSQHVDATELGDLASFPVRFLDEAHAKKGLLPTHYVRATGAVDNSSNGGSEAPLSMAANSSDYYDTLINMWLLTGKQEDMYRRMWQKAMDEALELLFTAAMDGSVMLGVRRGDRIEPKMAQATCFFPGAIANGALHGGVDNAKLWFYMDNASKLMETCWRMHDRTATGLSAVEIHVSASDINVVEMSSLRSGLWPETAKSLLHMWRATKDPKFRNMGWAIFRAMSQHATTPEGAFAAVHNVNEVPTVLEDSMPIHVTAQTLKFLWLLFGPDDAFNAEWAFTAGGHPLRVPEAEQLLT